MDVTNEAALNIRKFPRELLGKLKNAAAVRGMKLQEYVTEVLAKSQEENHVEKPETLPGGGDSEPAMRYAGRAGSAGTSAKGPQGEIELLEARAKRIWCGKVACLECAVERGKLHRSFCGTGDRMAAMAKEVLEGKKGVMPIASGLPNTESERQPVAVTGASPSGNETGSPSILARLIKFGEEHDERKSRIRERYNMDSRDCLECGVAPNLKHKAYCSIGDRLAGETG